MPESLTYQRGREAAEAIEGVQIVELSPNRDERGAFTEFFREEWPTGLRPVQWNILHSHAGAVRGMHVHHCHEDFQALVSGRATIALADLRRDQPRASVAMEVTEDDPVGVIVPRGVAHGFYFNEPAIFLVGVTREYDPDDDIAIRPDDPDLGIAWPAGPRILSERDTNAPPLAEVLERIERYQPFSRI